MVAAYHGWGWVACDHISSQDRNDDPRSHPCELAAFSLKKLPNTGNYWDLIFTKYWEPNQTKPSQTKPNRTKPNQTKPAGVKLQNWRIGIDGTTVGSIRSLAMPGALRISGAGKSSLKHIAIHLRNYFPMILN